MASSEGVLRLFALMAALTEAKGENMHILTCCSQGGFLASVADLFGHVLR